MTPVGAMRHRGASGMHPVRAAPPDGARDLVVTGNKDRTRSRVPAGLRAADWLFGGLLLFGAMFLVWLVSGVGTPEERALVSDLVFLPVGLCAVALAVRTAASTDLDRVTRRAWGFVALAFGVYWLGDVLWAWYNVVLGEIPWPSLADAAYLAFFPILLVGLLSFPAASRGGLDRVRFLLDAAIVLIGGTMVVWYLVLGPTAATTDVDAATLALSLAYPVGDLLMLFGIALVALRSRDARSRRAIACLVTSLVTVLVADLIYGYQSIEGTYASAGPADAGYMIAWISLAAAAWTAVRDAETARRERRPLTFAPSASLLPYLAIVGAYGLLLAAPRDRGTPLDGLIYGSVILTAVVVARQVVVMRENRALIDEQGRREARFRSLVQHASDVITVVGSDGTVSYQTASVGRILGYRETELVGSNLAGVVHPDDRDRFLAVLGSLASQPGTSAPTEVRWRRADGGWATIESIGTNLLDDPSVAGIVLNSRDTSERKALEEQLVHQAFHDPLTGLANRALFQDRVEHARARLAREARLLAVLFLDLDDFKRVNDSLGHAVGDELLVAAADRLRDSLRPADTVARLGGDEFAILLEEPPTSGDPAQVAARISDAMSRPFMVAGRPVIVGVSIGLALSGDASLTTGDLLRNADIAMYLAKRRGKGRVETFQPAMQEAMVADLELEAELRAALDEGRFAIEYQPIVSLPDQILTGVEALVRWDHPTRGRLPAGRFIELAEQTGLIVPLGRWVLDEACRQAADWRRRGLLPEGRSVHVNISARQLAHPSVVATVRDALAQSAIDPRSLVLELTETAMLGDTATIRPVIASLKRLGLRLAIDDFGKGYASIGYLRELPIDILKVDRAFVIAGAESGPDEGDGALLRGIIQLGHTLGLETVAEGVELDSQVDVLVALGCDRAQGYRFATPLPVEALEPILLAGTVGAPTLAAARGTRARRRPARTTGPRPRAIQPGAAVP
jgi:diguanylate cyclase (GGDEF)-like protein/PAS domain S-box-containing protein